MNRHPAPSRLDALIDGLRRLPGVGPKSAQRIAYHLLQHDRDGAATLGDALTKAVAAIRHCRSCNTFTEHELCDVCSSDRRDRSLLCVVETPADQLMIEQTLTYRGPLLRADGPAVAARRHRSEGHPSRPAAAARDRRRRRAR